MTRFATRETRRRDATFAPADPGARRFFVAAAAAGGGGVQNDGRGPVVFHGSRTGPALVWVRDAGARAYPLAHGGHTNHV